MLEYKGSNKPSFRSIAVLLPGLGTSAGVVSVTNN